MKTIQLNLYPFAELSESVKEKVIEDHFYINVSHAWWGFIYDDAETAGLKITGFDFDRGNYCNAEFTQDAIKCASLVITNHGEQTDTYQTAQSFREKRDKIVIEWPKEIDGDWKDIDGLDEALDKLEDRFLTTMCRRYLEFLTACYDELISKEAIIETLIANDYFFTADGELATHLEILAI
jgi:hypothetical protein